MTWIYLSPHLDDAAFSCGGLIWDQTQCGGKVEVWTICAGDPPEGALPEFAQSLHDRWKTGEDAVALRRNEDAAALKLLGASHRWFEVLDCIYRRDPLTGTALYDSGAAVFGELRGSEMDQVQSLAGQLRAQLFPEDTLVVPLTIGNHVDHQLTRRAAEEVGRPMIYYADFPYVVNNEHLLGFLMPPRSRGESHQVSRPGVEHWQAAIGAYTSQTATFWPDSAAMKNAVEAYWSRINGLQLWHQV
ncbi:MAG: PIG-L family deacetylase [Chloroflexi bacterium]|nr:PIG-L family deacetylase [Chloroflexota bacterium]